MVLLKISIFKRAVAMSDEETAASLPTNTAEFVKHPGVRCTEPGKWVAKIRHPINKVWVWLGTYPTPEEAIGAYTRKKLEYESGQQSDVSQRRPRHVYLRQSGRWWSEFRNPVTKARFHLGTYDTAAEAEEAYNKKRREFDLMFHAHKKQKESIVGCKGEAKQSNNTAADKPFACADGSSVIETVKEEEVGGNMNYENVENMPMHYVESRGECNLGVIDCYGQLVGEYSRLDDELWLCKAEDDDAFIGRP